MALRLIMDSHCDSVRNSKRKYKKKIRRLFIELYPTDKDILDKLNTVPAYSSYIKFLIRKDIGADGGARGHA